MEQGQFITLDGDKEHHLLILGGLVHHPATYPSVTASKSKTQSGNPLLVRSHFLHTEKNNRSRLGNKTDWENGSRPYAVPRAYPIHDRRRKTAIPFQHDLYTRAAGIAVFSSHGVHRMVVIARLCRGKKVARTGIEPSPGLPMFSLV